MILYNDIPSDVDETRVLAECENCHSICDVPRESAWTDDNGNLWTDCMCSELPDNILDILNV